MEESNINYEIYLLQTIDELMEYLYIRPVLSGLKVDLYVDDSGSYIRNQHPLLMFVSNGIRIKDSFIPFTIESNPRILNGSVNINISSTEISSIKRFISQNFNAIIDLANDSISQIDFIKQLKTCIL